ncbi:MAG: c-type cytochrome [Candidatus Eiseniibacteriota bacterium]
MISPDARRSLLVAGCLVVVLAAPLTAQPPASTFKNLKVLPKDISRAELMDHMGAYTRALGVRCIHCHVGEQGKPLDTYQFDLDDKPTKIKARAMMEMTRDINQKYLASLEHRNDPPTGVQCITCHRGVTNPQRLQEILLRAYEQNGLDSTIVRYQGLRQRYYGRAAYDFGEVTLADVANAVGRADHTDDAVRLNALNVEMNPTSAYAKRVHATAAIAETYRDHGPEAGEGAYEDFQSRYGTEIVSPQLMNEVGARLLAGGQKTLAIGLFQRLAKEAPESADAWVHLADAYAATGDTKRARDTYQKALKLDPANADAKEGIEQLKK